MPSPSATPPELDGQLPDDADAPTDDPSRSSAVPGAGPASALPPDIDTLPVPGITRRRVAFVIAAVFSAWVVVVFARQVSEAAAATSRADDAVVANAALTAEVAALQRELDLVQARPYILQQARAHGLGKEKEIPFTLADDAPPLPADAPGSAAQALGASQDRSSPLDTWLRLLFGPGADG
jgi:cell division protein FtsB